MRTYIVNGRPVTEADFGRFIAELLAKGWTLNPPDERKVR